MQKHNEYAEILVNTLEKLVNGRSGRPTLNYVAENILRYHRTLQSCAILFLFQLLYILGGLSDLRYTDMRNRTAIERVKAFKKLVDDGDFDFNIPFI